MIMPITKQGVAVIGAGGQVGATMAERIAGGNYRLLLFDRDVDVLNELRDAIVKAHPEAEVRVMHCAYDCSWEADIIVLANAHEQKEEVAAKIQKVATQKIVINVVDGTDEEEKSISVEDSIAELQQWLPHSKLAEIRMAVIGEQGSYGPIDIYITEKGEKSIKTINELIETVGFKLNNTHFHKIEG